MHVTEIPDYNSFLALKAEWDALVADTDDQIFYRHDFIRTWIESFAPGARLRVLVGRGEAGQLEAVLPLMRERASIFGAPVVQLTTTSNAHSCRFDLVAKEPEVAGQAFLRHLIKDKSWHVLRILDVPEDGKAWHIYEAACKRGYPTGTWSSINSPHVAVAGSREEFEASLSSRFRSFLRRRRKKLLAKGEVAIEHFTGGPELAARLEEGFDLEQSGWKGREGTAIAQSPDTLRFYTRLAEFAQGEGYLSLHYLRLDGKAVAFQYGLVYKDRYCLLKPAYDEAVPEASPGQLLMQEVLGYCADLGLKEYDFLGPAAMWKLKWTKQTRHHTWLFVFRRTAYGRTLRDYKFRWVPAGKRLITHLVGEERLATFMPDDGTGNKKGTRVGTENAGEDGHSDD